VQGERDPHAVVHLEETALVGHPRTVPAARRLHMTGDQRV
jgi:hypothetical protein